MDTAALLLTLVVLILLWLILVGLTTSDFRARRHDHRQRSHFRLRH